MNEQQLKQARMEMVNQQLKPRGITDANVLKAMQQTPREKFVPETFIKQSYKDGPLPIGYDQTISQPYIVALMCQLAELKGHEIVLDVGTGTGYQAAVLAHLAQKVISIERIAKLCHKARNNLAKAHCNNVTVYQCNARDDQALISAYQCLSF
jgi:protein-L-isoaspartate(D-aspartate) O-methyltransferase